MTHFATDRAQPGAGYWPSPWPVECGGNRRQKSAVGRLGAAEGNASVTTRRTARWDVTITRQVGKIACSYLKFCCRRLLV